MRRVVCVVLFSFSKLLEQKEQLEQKHLHLLQILDTERQSKWQYVQQTEELADEVRKLKSEVHNLTAFTLIRHLQSFVHSCHNITERMPSHQTRLSSSRCPAYIHGVQKSDTPIVFEFSVFVR